MFRPPCRVPFQLPGLSAAVCRNVLFPSLPVISIFGQIQRKLYSKRKILSRKTACGQNGGIATGESNHEWAQAALCIPSVFLLYEPVVLHPFWYSPNNSDNPNYPNIECFGRHYTGADQRFQWRKNPGKSCQCNAVNAEYCLKYAFLWEIPALFEKIQQDIHCNTNEYA